MAEFLRERGRWVGRGTMPGTCYDLGNYPGAVYAEDSPESVEGDIFELPDPAPVFAVLDRYEGIAPYGHPPEYERVVRRIKGCGRDFDCWVYLYLPPDGGQIPATSP